jgi:hypothetical protein
MTKGKKKHVPRPGANPDLPKPPKIKKVDSPTNARSRSRSPLKSSDSSNKSSDFFASDDEIKTIDTSSDSEASSNMDTKSHSQPPQKSETKTPLPPPITIPSGIWLDAAPLIFKNPDIQSEGIIAKASAEGQILIKTINSSQFRQVQKCLIDNSIEFHSYSLPAERLLKVVIRGVPTKVPIERVQSELEQLNFDIKIVRRFGSVDKPMPICLVILSGVNAKEIFQQTELLFLKITVEAFRKSGPSQCHNCQGFGHGSTNCGHPPRCVKCAGDHPTKECQKTRETDPKCANCGAAHTANYRGCPSHTNAAKLANPRANLKQASTTLQYSKPTQAAYPPINAQSPATTQITPKSANYAQAVKGTTPPNQDLISLLVELLSAITTADDPKAIMLATINSFIKILSPNHNV